MSLPSRVLLEGEGYCDGAVAQVLPVHGLNGRVGCLEARKIDESVALGIARLHVSHDLWCLENYPKGTECVVEKLLIYLWVQVPDEDVGSDIEVLLMGRGLVDSDWLAIQLDHVEYLDGIISILLPHELHKAIPLVRLCHPVLRHVGVYYRTRLQKELP